MIFKLKAHYFGRTVTVIADNNWQEVLAKKGKFNDLSSIEDWLGGFFTSLDGDWFICLTENPGIGTITHEVVHFVNEIYAFIGYNPDVRNDEMQAYMISYFTEEIFKKIYNNNKM